MRHWILGFTFLLLAPAGAGAFCSATCPAAAGCFGECSIDTEVNSPCATVCSANCAGATCRLIGGIECTYTEYIPCDRRPPKISSHPEDSPLDARWAILSIDDGWSALLPEEAVLAASSLDFAQAAARNLAELENDRLGGELPSLLPRTVFIVAPVAHQPADPVLTLREPSLRPRADDDTKFFFRAATDGQGIWSRCSRFTCRGPEPSLPSSTICCANIASSRGASRVRRSSSMARSSSIPAAL